MQHVFEQSSNEYLRINTTNGSEKIILGDNGTNPKINFNGEYDFPTADGSAGQVLTTDGSGTLSFSSAGSGTVSGSGTNGYISIWTSASALSSSVLYQNNGLIGISTTNPTRKLHIDGGSASSTSIYIDANSINGTDIEQSANDFRFQVRDNIPLLFFTNNSEKVRIAADGNVGIGQVDPKADLHIGSSFDNAASDLGTAALAIKQTSTSAENGIYIERTGERKGYYIGIAGVDGLTFRRNFSGTKSDIMSLTREGNVGIGTASPDNPLEVFGADSGIKISSASNNRPHLRLECGTAEKLRLSANTVYGAIGDSSDTNRYMAFKDGNIGIATVTPGVKLHVAGQGLFANNGANIILANSWSSGNTDVLFGGSGVSTGSATNTAARIRCLATAPGGAATGSLTFTVNSGDTFVDALYIKENGNVGIGTNAPVAKLTLPLEEENGFKIAFKAASGDGHAGLSTVDQNGAGLMIAANAYINAGGVPVAGNSSNPSLGIYFDGWSGDRMKFVTAASGNPAERMCINAAGKVIVNDTATTNNNNAQLYVNGPVYGSEFDLPSWQGVLYRLGKW